MKKDIKNTKTEFSISKINRIIGKINKTGLILIVLCYIVILSFALSMIGKDISYVTEPNYDHQYYNNEISPQISIVGVRDFDDNKKESLKYSVSVNIAGRQVNNVDPGYKITSFRMFASTKNEITNQLPDGTYYFTEHNTYSTPITHNYSINNSEVGQHPSTFYVRLEYEKDGGKKVTTFKENVFIQPTSNDIDGMDSWYHANIDTTVSAINIKPSDDGASVGVVEFQSYDDSENKDIIKAGLRIKITDTNLSKFHIDMQSWIITKDGKYLPFIGVYNYTGPSLRYSNTSKDINKNLKPEYLAAKVVWTDAKGVQHENYFKQKIDQINDNFLVDTNTGVDAGTQIKNNRGLYITLAVVSSVALVAVVVFGTYVFSKKQQKEKK